jgi:hypothetical protein
MTTSDEKIIEISKTKIFLWILVACAFVAIGLWVLSFDTISGKGGSDATLVAHSAAIFVMVVFSLFGAVCIYKILKNKPGLVFNSVGIVSAYGLIPWGDVTGISVNNVVIYKMLVVMVANPDKYIKVGNPLKRLGNWANYKNVGSPIIISPYELKIDVSDLQRIAGEYFLKYGKRA